MLRPDLLVGTIPVVLLFASCTQSPPSPVSDGCARAFATAALVDPLQDRHEDLLPAYTACTSLDEWKVADRLYPAAIDGVEPIRYAATVCAGNRQTIGDSPICRAVAASSTGPVAPYPVTNAAPSVSAPVPDLKPSGATGLLDAPLPAGAVLLDRTAADPALSRDASERYSISGNAAAIAAFFNREMTRAGWTRDPTSTETALFFEKGRYVLGVLMNRRGGTFTLMGS